MPKLGPVFTTENDIDISSRNPAGLLPVGEDLEISKLVSLNHDGALFYILISHANGRHLSKALPRQLCEQIVDKYHAAMKLRYPGLHYEIKIISKKPNEDKYSLVR